MTRAMKDSGIKWIGQIPSSWKVIRLKYTSWLKGRIGWEGLRSDEFVEDRSLPYLVTGTDFKNGEVCWDSCVHVSYARYCQDLLIHLSENDLLITKDGTIGKVAIARNCPHQATLNSGIFIIRNTRQHKYNDRFLYYLLMSPEFESWFKLSNAGNSTILHLNQEKFYNFAFAYPPMSEQVKIANCLDEYCKKIDEVWNTVQNQIDVLEAYKRAVICEVVTKGLQNSSYTDSGIKWVGKIPDKWLVKPLYLYVSEGKMKNSVLAETNLLSLSYGKIIRKDINSLGGLLPASYTTYNVVEAGDVIIRPTDLQNDKRSLRTGLVKEKGIITSAYIDLKPKEGMISSFLHYLLHCYDVKKVFYNMGNGVRQSLNYSEFSKLLIIVPPLPEQQAIADYLDKKCAEIDSIIADKKAQLEVLDEYKKSVIYEYVTGKKEVA